MEYTVIQAFQKILSYLPMLFDEEIGFSLVADHQFLAVKSLPGIPVAAKAGQPVARGGATYEALQTGKQVVRDVPPEVYGVAFRSLAVPLVNDKNQVCGAVTVIKSLEKSRSIQSASQKLFTVLKEISEAMEELGKGVEQVLEINHKILSEMKQAVKNSEETEAIIEYIRSVAHKTHMLGLNAAIEAARAGEGGRGFQVVAREVRHLSADSKASVEKINATLQSLVRQMTGVSREMEEANIHFEGQAGALEEIAAALCEIRDTAQDLELMAARF